MYVYIYIYIYVCVYIFQPSDIYHYTVTYPITILTILFPDLPLEYTPTNQLISPI